jgi:sulfur transfer complex TusBCD TusB component (DsrH family)
MNLYDSFDIRYVFRIRESQKNSLVKDGVQIAVKKNHLNSKILIHPIFGP